MFRKPWFETPLLAEHAFIIWCETAVPLSTDMLTPFLYHNSSI